MATANTTFDLPPLPDYTLQPLPPLISWFPDAYLQLAMPIISYWVVSGIFHVMDVYDLSPQYRLHTPAEILKRNHVTRWECFRDVILQQIIQTFFGVAMNLLDEHPTFGKADYDVAWYAQKLRLAQRAIPLVVGTLGLNPSELSSKLSSSQPMLASVLAGGRYPNLVQMATIAGHDTLVPTFAPWELIVAKFLYWYAIPALQFITAIIILDTWEYFLHRAMHMNKWLYVNLHSRHHRLYVPYAYGALYNHPLEGFLLDTLGTGFAYLVTGMTVRQGMWFFGGCSAKTVDDHCGYALPWDPLQHITSNNAKYHDIHHQSWGIKSNFSQPFFTFWDRFLGTMWTEDVTSRYERGRRAAQRKLDQEAENTASDVADDETAISTSAEVDDSVRASASTPTSTKKKAGSISQPSANLKGLRNKVNESLQGRGGNVLGVERPQ